MLSAFLGPRHTEVAHVARCSCETCERRRAAFAEWVRLDQRLEDAAAADRVIEETRSGRRCRSCYQPRPCVCADPYRIETFERNGR